MRAPFPWFGGKSKIAPIVWRALGTPKQYIEPFCGSAAILLTAPRVASLEVVNDINGFLVNFWRAVKSDPGKVADWADYPVSHIDLGARHVWMMGQRDRLGTALQDPNWPGDYQLAGWWLWGQCCWIGSGWCEWLGKIPHAGNAGRGVQALGQIPHAGNAGMGSAGATAHRWLGQLARRLDRVRMTHGSWDRCLNSHYGGGGTSTAVFLDPPYKGTDAVYGTDPVADAVESWARDNASLRIVLAGHAGDYDLPGWGQFAWERGSLTYGGSTTRADEVLYLSPACAPASAQVDMFEAAE